MDCPSLKGKVSDEEWQVRCDLAAAYRLVAMQGWDDLVFTHISARVPGPEDHFLINPYGFLFEEITASSLVKVDLAGQKVMDSPFEINPAGYIIHSAVHSARPDAGCVMHLHTDAGVAVSAQTDGLLPLSQTAMIALASLSYHAYEGIALNPEERERLIADLGEADMMILRNHGTMTLGANVGGAYLRMHLLEKACAYQLLAQSGSGELTRIPAPILLGVKAQIREVTRGMGADIAWPALIRKVVREQPGFDS